MSDFFHLILQHKTVNDVSSIDKNIVLYLTPSGVEMMAVIMCMMEIPLCRL